MTAAPSPRLVPVRSRWRAVGGDVIDCFGRTVPLSRARDTAEGYWRAGRLAEKRGDAGAAERYWHDALELSLVTAVAYQDRLAEGRSDPFAEAGDAA